MLDITGSQSTRSSARAARNQVLKWALAGLVVSGFAGISASGEVMINEIHFNPGKLSGESQREKQEEEFLELFNSGTETVSLDGWRFSRGVDYTFGDVSIAPGGYLVIAADTQAFQAKHPDVQSFVGPYEGQLSNSSEDIELEDASGKRIDLIEYADSGHWAGRRTTKLKSYDHWEWVAPHDGEGMSLEVVDPEKDRRFAHAWAPSKDSGGSPGKVNTVAMTDRSPSIGKVEHAPAVPNSRDPIEISTSIDGDAERVRVLYRRDGAARFKSADLAVEKGGRWMGTIPAHGDGSVVEYLIEATAKDGSIRRWPELQQAAGRDPEHDSITARQALCMFHVDDGFSNEPIVKGDQRPLYKIIMPRREIALMRSISGRSSNNSVYNNRYNGTFISVDPGGTRVRHLCSLRIRGNGSRSAFPPGLRLTFPSDDTWKGVQNINLNSQYPHSQVLGAAIHQVMGFPAARATPVVVRMNGEDWTRSGLPQFGHYTCNEVLDSDYIDAHFPTEAIGNLYRGVGSANLNNRGDRVSSYRTRYRKRNNASADDFSDVIQLCRVLDRNGDKTVSDAQFLAEVKQIVDVDQWMRYFALDALLCNLEGGFPTGRGDDYAMFRGSDGRFRLVPYDLDSILGRGEPGEDLTKSIFSYGNTSGLRRLFKHPEVVRIYFHHIRDLLNTSYRPEVLNRIIDEVLGSWVPESEIEEIKEFIPRRIAVVRSQIEGYTVTGSTLEFAGGFHRTERPDFLLYGRFDPADVVGVRVNGRKPTSLDMRAGTWVLRASAENPLVSPGITPVVIEMSGGIGEIVDRSTLQIWYDNGKMTEVAGELPSGATHWDATSGPYLVTQTLTVPLDGSLQIEPGTSVFFAAGAELKVEGQLDAEGTMTRPIRFAAPVTGETKGNEAPATWRGILFKKGSSANRIVHAGIDGAENPEGVLRAKGSVLLQNVVFGRCMSQAITAEDAHLDVLDCEFVAAGGFVRASGGEVRVEGCNFGAVSGKWAVEINGKLMRTASVQRNSFASGGSSGCLSVGDDALIMKNLFGAGSSPADVAVVMSKPANLVLAGNGFLGWKVAISVADGGRGVFEKNSCRFSSDSVVAGAVDGFYSTNNLVVAEGVAGAFVQPDSAWVAGGRRANWSFLEVEHATAGASIDLLTVSGVPPGGKSAPGTRSITFRYPGAASFRKIGSENEPHQANQFSATFMSDGSAPLGLEITLLTGEVLEFPNAARWKPLPGHVDVIINEVVALESDAIELRNYSPQPVDLSGFRLTDDRAKPDKFVFPEGTQIPAHGCLVLKLGKKEPRSGALEAGFGLSGDGEELLLLKPVAASSEEPVDSVRFGSQIAGFSIGRIGDHWQLCKPTLGSVNNQTVAVASPRSVRLGEWLAAGGGSSGDFIELTNEASIPADVSRCGLTDNIPTAPFRHRFAPLSFLPAKGAKAFFAKGKKSKPGQLEFKLSDDGEVLGFLTSDGITVDWAVFQPQATGRSQGRDASGNLVAFAVPTPGVAAGSTGMAAAAALASALRISEIHYHPEDDEDSEFMEVTNVSSQALDVGGVRVAGGVDFLFQEGVALSPAERRIVVRDRKAFERAYGNTVVPIGEYSGKLSNKGEKIRLVSPEGISIQQLEYSDKWHKATDGGGRSLEAIDLTPTATDWSRKKSWKPSKSQGGTPGAQ